LEKALSGEASSFIKADGFYSWTDAGFRPHLFRAPLGISRGMSSNLLIHRDDTNAARREKQVRAAELPGEDPKQIAPRRIASR
jgi:hypothetical protein